MKFKKDGKVFEDILAAHYKFKCPGLCSVDCPLCRPSWEYGIAEESRNICDKYVEDNPAEAARLMGYEVVDTGYSETYNAVRESCNQWPEWKKEIYNANLSAHAKPLNKAANMDKQKPLKDWTLGEVKGFCVARTEKLGNSSNTCETCPMNGFCAIDVGQWDLTEKLRFTEAEVAFAKAMYAVIPDGVIMRNAENTLSWDVLGLGMQAWRDNRLPYKMFPSIQPGQSVKISDIVGGDTE